MALNNIKFTEKVMEAGKYFSELEKSEKNRIEIDNGEMLAIASYAASIFQDSWNRRVISEKLDEDYHHFVILGRSSEEVMKTCRKYAEGKKEFSKHSIEQARIVCHSLVEYINFLEKDKKIQQR